MVSASVHPSPIVAADEGLDAALVARRFSGAVAVVHRFTGHGIGVSRSTAVLFDGLAIAVCPAIRCLGHIARGKGGEREACALPKKCSSFRWLGEVNL